MAKEAPKKKAVDSSLFLIELYEVKNKLEKLIIELEAIKNE